VGLEFIMVFAWLFDGIQHGADLSQTTINRRQ
jgi:hypothetical protein